MYMGGGSMLQQQVSGETSRGDTTLVHTGEIQRNPWTNRSANTLERDRTGREDFREEKLGKVVKPKRATR